MSRSVRTGAGAGALLQLLSSGRLEEEDAARRSAWPVFCLSVFGKQSLIHLTCILFLPDVSVLSFQFKDRITDVAGKPSV